MWAVLFVLACDPLISASWAQSLRITQPANNGDAVKGRYVFKVDTNELPNVSTVEFAIGSLSLGIARTTPFQVRWDTGYGKDGNYSLHAFARDTSGQIISTAERVFNIANAGGTSYVSFPDISHALSGTIALKVTIKDPLNYPVASYALIDGQPAGYWDLGSSTPAPEQTATFTIDTSRFRNGTHELVVNTRGRKDPNSPQIYSNYSEMLDRTVTINNDHALMEIASNYQHVYLKPAQRISLMCRQLFVDGGSGPCAAPAYSTDNPSVVSVSGDGRLTATGKGFAVVSISDSSRTTRVFVWVKEKFEIPHFSSAGQILSSYQRGNSIFPIAPFVLDPVFLRSDAYLLNEVKKAGINTVTFGFYWNPRSTDTSFADWKRSQDGAITWRIQWAKENGFHIIGTGDDSFRRPGDDAWWTLNWRYGQQAISYAMQTLARSGAAIALEVVDEASSFFGWYPLRPSRVGEPGISGQPASFKSIACDGSVCTVNWPRHGYQDRQWVAFRGSVHDELNTTPGSPFVVQHATQDAFDFVPNGMIRGTFTSESDPGLEVMLFAAWPCNAGTKDGTDHPCNPFTMNSAVKIYSTWLRNISPRVPFSWPALGLLPAAAHANWIGQLAINQGISDYASHYWDALGVTRTYPWSNGVQQRTSWMKEAFYSRQPYMAQDRPQLMLVCGSSFAYMKQTESGAYYNPQKDILDQPGCDASAASAEIMTATALGSAGVRQYQFGAETPDERSAFKIGTYLQTGMRPDADEGNAKEIWQATGYAANLLTKVLQPYVLGSAANSPAYESNITTAVRHGMDATMLMVVNGSDAERTLSIDFTDRTSGTNITRYRLGTTYLQTDLLPDSAGETITLPGGGSVVYLFPLTSATNFLQPRFLRPALPAGAITARLSYTYIYIEHVLQARNSIDCTDGCTIEVDPRLGDLYYQFTYAGVGSRFLGRSDVTKLALNRPTAIRRSQ